MTGAATSGRQTIAQKIYARNLGREAVRVGEIITVTPDCTVLIDPTFIFLNQMKRKVLKVADPSRVAIIFDHEVPALSIASAAAQRHGRDFAREFGIKRFHDVGADQGISHVLVVDRGYARPGTILIGSDSHSLAAGAINCAARAITFLDLILALTTGKTWLKVPPTIRYDFVGALRPDVYAKDVFLHLANGFGSHVGHAIEFGGPGLAGLSINARRTLATQATELNAESAIFEADGHTADFFDRMGIRDIDTVAPDADADYAERRTVDLSQIGPMIATPDGVLGNARPAADLGRQRIDQAFIGSCANGVLDDLADAARVMEGKRVAEGVRLIVTPASQQIYRQAVELGYVRTLLDAGAVVTNPTCGACGGGHLGVLGPGEICITSSTRNYRGRMGDPTARIYMASSATVAASAVAGHIATEARD